MNKSIVRCRCGHQVLSKEVLRTDLYERRAPGDSSRDYVYVKYRCRRCKRMGETFVAESRWDWAMLEAEPNEMTDQERDRFLDEEIVTPEDIIDFHRHLETFVLSDLAAMVAENDVLESVDESDCEETASSASASGAISATASSATASSATASSATASSATASSATALTPSATPTPEPRAIHKAENGKSENAKNATAENVAPRSPDEPRPDSNNDPRSKCS